MFCSSLRRRSDLQELVTALTDSPKLHDFKESNLKTFDLALAIPPRSGSNKTSRRLQVLVLTSASLDDKAKMSTMTRIEHFSALGAESIAVAFVLSTRAHPSFETMDGHRAFLTLQLMILGQPNLSSIPILPITSSISLLSELNTYTESLHRYSYLTFPQYSARTNLLPHTTLSAPSHPMSEHDTNVLSDICHSLPDVSKLAASEQGYLSLKEWLEEAAEGVVGFWQEELIL
ncbi:hypothetical protein MMC26_002983 [Xylographa opegraphella]|nr:hypothetical protein [Xylographa opegraphella]